jgi:hypothetical protein
VPKANKKGITMGNQAAQTGLDQNAALSKRATSLQDTLEPQLEQDIQAPQGYGQSGLNAMNTAAQQSAGGATAGLVGEGMARAARTGNRGSFTAAAAEAGRQGARATSQRAVEIQSANEKLKQEQRARALTAKQGLFNTDLSGSLQALGLVPGGIDAANKSRGPSFLDTIQQLSQIGGNAANIAAIA